MRNQHSHPHGETHGCFGLGKPSESKDQFQGGTAVLGAVALRRSCSRPMLFRSIKLSLFVVWSWWLLVPALRCQQGRCVCPCVRARRPQSVAAVPRGPGHVLGLVCSEGPGHLVLAVRSCSHSCLSAAKQVWPWAFYCLFTKLQTLLAP